MKSSLLIAALVLAGPALFGCESVYSRSYPKENCEALEIKSPTPDVRCFMLVCDVPHYETLSCVRSEETVK